MTGRPSARSRGFTLIEVVVTLAILGALAAAILPLTVQQREQRRLTETRDQLRAVHEAILGTPADFDPEDDRSFGFLGDMGSLPAELTQLQSRDTFPSYAITSSFGIGAGWRGPYLPDELTGDSVGVRTDPFGRPLRYSTTDTSVGGLDLTGQIRSAGPDGTMNTDDDILSPVLERQATAEVHGFLVSAAGQPFASAPVGLVFRRNGSIVDTAIFTDDDGRWALSGVPLGTAVTIVRSGGGQGSGFLGNSSVISQENFTNQEDDVGFSVANVTSEPLTLSTLVVTVEELSDQLEGEVTKDEICFRQATVDGRLLLSPGASEVKCSGDTLSISPNEQIPASPAAAGSGSRKKFVVHRPVEIAPELAISFGDDDVSRSNWQLLNWHDDFGTGNKVDVRNVVLTITFNDGLSHTFRVRGTQ